MLLNKETKTNQTIHPYHPSRLAGLLDCIQCPHKADLSKSLLLAIYWHVDELESIREGRSSFRPCFSSCTPLISCLSYLNGL